jgi:adenine-specific DNA-methyltransferase
MKYIGNKTRLLEFIEESLVKSGVPMQGVFTDLFAGTGSVGQHFKRKGFSVISNDFLYFSYVLQKAFVEENAVPHFDLLKRHLKAPSEASVADSVIQHLNMLPPARGYAYENYGADGVYKRQYFTADNAGRIDAIRESIADWSAAGLINEAEFHYLLALLIDAADHVANMSGTYGAFLKVWRSVALKRIQLVEREVHGNSQENRAFNVDAHSLVVAVKGDVLYLDPPYNSRQYAPNFHVLESLAVWDKQQLTGKTGLRNYDYQKSAFSSRKGAAAALEQIVSAAKFKYIVLSYNNEGIIPHERIVEILSSRGRVLRYKKDYRRFRTERDHSNRQYKSVGDRTTESLFVVLVER